jgi:hypothetical protein
MSRKYAFNKKFLRGGQRGQFLQKAPPLVAEGILFIMQGIDGIEF